MPDIERLVNREDAADIITALNAIANKTPRRFIKPTVTDPIIEYDGETHSITEVLDNYDPNFMLLTGTVTTDEMGVHGVQVQLKRSCDTWVDDTTDVVYLLWVYGDFDMAITWANGSDEDIALAIQLADEGFIDLQEDLGWAIGDERVVQLSAVSASGNVVAQSAQQATLVLMDTDHYYLEDGVTKSKFVIGMKNSLETRQRLYSSDDNSMGWKGCFGPEACAHYLNMFPDYLKNAFKPFKVWTADAGGSSSATSSFITQTLSLFAVKEVFGTQGGSAKSEADGLTQIEWYKTTANRKKKQGDSGSANISWWTRSPDPNYSYAFRHVSDSGDESSYLASTSVWFSLFGCI